MVSLGTFLALSMPIKAAEMYLVDSFVEPTSKYLRCGPSEGFQRDIYRVDLDPAEIAEANGDAEKIVDMVAARVYESGVEDYFAEPEWGFSAGTRRMQEIRFSVEVQNKGFVERMVGGDFTFWYNKPTPLGERGCGKR